MAEPPNLKHLLQSGQVLNQPRASGYVIGMPDGKGGHQQVPVELAACLLLDMAVNVLMRIEGILNEMKMQGGSE